MSNPYMEEAKAILTGLETFSANQTDKTLVDNMAAFPYWNGNGIDYKAGVLVQYSGNLYRVIQPHKSQNDWTPDVAVSLFVKVSVEEYPQWEQPTGAHDAYMKGAKVSDEGKHWISNKDYNIYKPGLVLGDWSEVA